MALLLHTTLLIQTEKASSWILTFQVLVLSPCPSIFLTFLHPLNPALTTLFHVTPWLSMNTCQNVSGEPFCQTSGAAALSPRALQRVGTKGKGLVIWILKSHPSILRPCPTTGSPQNCKAFTCFQASLISALCVYEPLPLSPQHWGKLAALILSVWWPSNPHCVCFAGLIDSWQAQKKIRTF